MEQLKDATKKVFAKNDVCPRCTNHMEIDFHEQAIVCEHCGLRIKVSSKYNRLVDGLALGAVLFLYFFLGVVLGLLL